MTTSTTLPLASINAVVGMPAPEGLEERAARVCRKHVGHACLRCEVLGGAAVVPLVHPHEGDPPPGAVGTPVRTRASRRRSWGTTRPRVDHHGRPLVVSQGELPALEVDELHCRERRPSRRCSLEGGMTGRRPHREEARHAEQHGARGDGRLACERRWSNSGATLQMPLLALRREAGPAVVGGQGRHVALNSNSMVQRGSTRPQQHHG